MKCFQNTVECKQESKQASRLNFELVHKYEMQMVSDAFNFVSKEFSFKISKDNQGPLDIKYDH